MSRSLIGAIPPGSSETLKLSATRTRILRDHEPRAGQEPRADFWLGGKDNYAVDRELARTMTEVNPGIPAMARANRAFIIAAFRKVAQAGVGQFLDLGAGLPTHAAVREAARAVRPDARVVYVDNDPVVNTHASALLDDRAAGRRDGVKEPADVHGRELLGARRSRR